MSGSENVLKIKKWFWFGTAAAFSPSSVFKQVGEHLGSSSQSGFWKIEKESIQVALWDTIR
jgi:hypothetical protein